MTQLLDLIRTNGRVALEGLGRLAFAALVLLAFARPAASFAADDEFLPVEAVFRYTAASDGREVTVHWTIAKGYYAYQARMSFSTDTPGFTVGAPVWPRAETHQDEYFGKQAIFRDSFDVRVPLTARPPSGGTLALRIKVQGCADAGLCYPPQNWTATVSLPAVPSGTTATPAENASPAGRAGGGLAGLLGTQRASSGDDFLAVDQAFRAAAVASGNDRARIFWEIAPGYYLYKARIKVASRSAEAPLAELSLPSGLPHEDEYFGRQEIYRGEVIAEVRVTRSGAGALVVPLEVSYQGCADAGLCYPPQTRTLNVSLDGAATGGAAASSDTVATGPGGDAGGATPFVSEQDRLANLIRSGHLLLVFATFFGLGLLLAFTPCVLPMVPILSGIIAGQGAGVSTARAFALSLSYVLGMAFTNTVAGVLAAVAGAHVQALFQQTWIIVLFGGLFVLLALSMFGVYTLQMPAAIQTRLSETSNRQRAGTFGGVAVMGALSALIVTACVAPPLVATLAVIGQSGDVFRGGGALFMMSLGMGAPLLVVGASAGKLLPRAGAWMDTVKQFFGVMMLGVAAWMFARLVPDRVALILWAVPALIGAGLLWTGVRRVTAVGWVVRGASVAAALYGVALLAGAALGATDPLSPLPFLSSPRTQLAFKTIKSLDELESEVANATKAGKGVMLDFYADWCVSCKEMEKYTFTDPSVQHALGAFVLLRADVTANNPQDQALLNRFGIPGPPTIAFYGPDGIERRNYRVVGYMKAAEFAAVVRGSVHSAAAPAAAATIASTALR